MKEKKEEIIVVLVCVAIFVAAIAIHIIVKNQPTLPELKILTEEIINNGPF